MIVKMKVLVKQKIYKWVILLKIKNELGKIQLLIKGQLGERLNLLPWKGSVGKPTEGSNPSLSTTINVTRTNKHFYNI